MPIMRMWDGTKWVDAGQSVPANMVTTDTAQTITGKKTFTQAPTLPNPSVLPAPDVNGTVITDTLGRAYVAQGGAWVPSLRGSGRQTVGPVAPASPGAGDVWFDQSVTAYGLDLTANAGGTSANPIVIAHRGGANIFPENTMEAFLGAHALGMLNIEGGDYYPLADGGLGCMHDGTVDRTCSQIGNVQDLYTQGFRGLSVDANAWFSTNWGTLHPPTFEEVLERLGGKALLWPEAKVAGTAGAMITAIKKLGLENSVTITSFNFSECQAAVAAGIQASYQDTNGTSQSPATLAAAGISWVFASSTITASTVTALKAAGIKVGIYTPVRHSEVSPALANGVTAYYTNEPLYAQGAHGNASAYRRRTDPFTNPGFYHGQIPGRSGLRGVLNGDGWLQLSGTNPIPGGSGSTSLANCDVSVLQGWACPLGTPTAYSITFQMRIDAAGTDSSRWGSIFFASMDDGLFDDNLVDFNQGYHLLIRQTGQMALYRKDGASAATAGPSATALDGPFTTGMLVQVKVDVRSAGITVTQTPINTSGVATGVAATIFSWADTNYRGAYFYFNRNSNSGTITDRGFRNSFGNVTIGS